MLTFLRSRLNRLKPDLLVVVILLALPLILFWPVTVGGRTLLPVDNLFAVEPFRSAAPQFGADPVPHNRLLDDLVLENYPWKKFIIESLRSAQLPLWNPYQFAGLPFLAAGQHSALYPFSIIYYALPLPLAYGVFTVVQLFLAGFFTYLYLRVLGLGRLSALFGAIVYELCLFMVVSVVFQMMIAGAAWLPVVLMAIELVVRQQPAFGGRPATLPWLALGAVALGVQILAGHVEIVYYTLLVAGGYSAWRLSGVWRAVDEGTAWYRTLLTLRRSTALVLIAALGLGFGAIQFVPLLELATANFRSGSATYEQIVGWALPWRHAIAFLVPNFFGNPSHHGYLDFFSGQWMAATRNALGESRTTIDWGIKNYVEGGAYVGLLPLLLAPLTAVLWFRYRVLRRNESYEHMAPRSFSHIAPFYFLLAFFALAFAFGTPLYRLIFWLPGVDQLHSAFRWIWPFSFSLAVLSAYGIEYLQRSRERSSVPGRMSEVIRRQSSIASRLFCLWSEPSLITFIAGLAVWGGTAALAALMAARWQYERIAGLMDRLVAELALADHAFADGRMFFSYEARWIFIFALMLVASGIVLRVSRCPIYLRRRPLWEYLAVGVIALDLLVAGYGFNPSADPAVLGYTPPSVEFLRQDPELWRFTSFDSGQCRTQPDGQGEPCKPFNANIGWYYDLYDVRGYDSIFPMQYRRYMELIESPQSELDYNRIAPISELQALDSPLLDLLNVKYVVTEQTIPNPKYTLVYDAEVKIYRNETALPRAFTLPLSATLVSDDFGRTIQTFDPRQYVIVAPGVVTESGPPTPAQPGPVIGIYYTPNEVYVTAAVGAPSWLVLADSYFPGWKAYVRANAAGDDAEQETPIALVNGNFRGVQLPPGEWKVRFKYTPQSLKLGGLLSLMAGMTLIFGMGIFTWRYFYQESAVDSTARRIAKNSLAPMALNLMNRLIEMIFAAFYLRVLGPADVGKYYFAIVIFGWFEIVTNYGLNTLLTRDVSRDREHANRYLVNTTLLRLLLALAAIPVLGALLWARQSLPSFTLPFGLGDLHPDRLSADTLWAIGLLVLAQAPATVATGLSALFYVYEKAEYPAAVATIATLVKVGLGTTALVLGLGIVGLAGTSMVVNTITLVILGALVWRMFFHPRFEFDPAFQLHALRESFPLMLNNLLATLFFKVDVTLLEPIRGTKEVGWYSTAYKFIDAYNVVPALFTFALFPLMSRQAADPNEHPALRRSYALAVKLMVAVALPLANATAFLATVMVGLLGGREYLPFGATALAIMVWSMPIGWINSVTNYLLIALHEQRSLTKAFGVSLTFNVLANLLLLPRYGFVAAAAITIASEIFEGAWFYFYLRRKLGNLPWGRWLWQLALSGVVMTAVTYLLWPIQPLLALVAGSVLYLGGVIGLRAFDAEERAILADILPVGARRRRRLGK